MIIESIIGLGIYALLGHIVDYRIIKPYYLKSKKWCLNISCANTNGGGINADVIPRKVPNFVLIKNIYKLPFKDNQFENTICSHTMEHVEYPEKFYKELKRVSKNVTLLIPPLWDIVGFLDFLEHKWQFLTFKTNHTNHLPKKVKLPYWWCHKNLDKGPN